MADGKISRLSGTGRLYGSCAKPTKLAGKHFVWDLSFVRAKSSRPATITGTLTVGDTPLAANLTAVAGTATSAGRPVDPNSVPETFLALGVVIVATRLMGSLFRRLAQPPVVGEIIAGVLLGPSLLGLWFPSIVHGLFKPAVTDSLNMLAQLGLILFMFLIGLELDFKLLKGAGHTAILISHASIVVPFACGTAPWPFSSTPLSAVAGSPASPYSWGRPGDYRFSCALPYPRRHRSHSDQAGYYCHRLCGCR